MQLDVGNLLKLDFYELIILESLKQGFLNFTLAYALFIQVLKLKQCGDVIICLLLLLN